MDAIRYPIGKFSALQDIDEVFLKTFMKQIENLPGSLNQVTNGLTDDQLNMPYREGGWTIRQVVHHIADAHVNAYIRFRLALTESEPTIKPYEEAIWAELFDSRTAPIDLSLKLVEAIHGRWSILMNSLDLQDFKREVIHPESGRMNLEFIIQLYAWHGNHHVAQIRSLRERMKW